MCANLNRIAMIVILTCVLMKNTRYRLVKVLFWQAEMKVIHDDSTCDKFGEVDFKGYTTGVTFF